MELPNFTNPLLRRAFMCIEDGAWKDANGLLEQVLNQEPENAYAYLGKLLVKLEVKNYAKLEKQIEPFDNCAEYKKCIKFCDAELANYLKSIVVSIKYKKATGMLNSGSSKVFVYENAAKLFHEIAGNFDADVREKLCLEKINEIQELKSKKKKKNLKILEFFIAGVIIVLACMQLFDYFAFRNAKVGDIVKFGLYKDQAIEWRVLDVKDCNALLLSKEGLYLNVYYGRISDSDPWGIATWETCSLRRWLNNNFYNEAFNYDEKQKIVLSRVTADINPEYNNINPGRDTQDKVFLLSISEVNRYFANDEARKCRVTEYVKKHGRSSWWWPCDEMGYSSWWLRSPGHSRLVAARVHLDGSVDYAGDVVGAHYVVRPAMWVKIN